MRTLTAMFDDRVDAETARTRLGAVGIDADNVSIHDQSSLGASTLDADRTSHDATHATSRTVGTDDGPGIWASIKDFFSGDDAVYEEGMRRGGYLLTARVDEAMVDEAIDILDDDGTVDIDERAESWRNEGWTGGSTAGTTAGTTAAGTTAGLAATPTMPTRDNASAAPAMQTNDRGASSDRIIPIVEEQLSVGKREVERGGVRVRSYVTETPVHEQVTLRQEHVDVERRPVTGETRVDPDDVDNLFKEESFELRETGEEAVIAKTAVVREELAIRRSVDERTETVDDTVRRTEVEVEDLDGTNRR